jgi:hypothetical protein
MTIDGGDSAVIMNKVFAQASTAVTLDSDDATTITATTPYIILDATNITYASLYHDIGLTAGTVVGQEVTLIVNTKQNLNEDETSNVRMPGYIRVGRQPARASGAVISLDGSGSNINNKTLIITDSSGTSTTLTFTTDTSNAAAHAVADAGTRAWWLGVNGLSTTANVGNVIEKGINQAFDAGDLDVFAAHAGGTVVLTQGTGGTDGNDTAAGGDGSISGTIITDGAGDAGVSAFTNGAAAPSGVDTTSHPFGCIVGDTTRWNPMTIASVTAMQNSCTWRWNGSKWDLVSGVTVTS